jgi:hypothetical protein
MDDPPVPAIPTGFRCIDPSVENQPTCQLWEVLCSILKALGNTLILNLIIDIRRY